MQGTSGLTRGGGALRMNLVRSVVIVTPESVSLEYPLAGLGSRFVALFVDTLLQAVLLVVVGLAAISLAAAGLVWQEVGSWAVGGGIMTAFLVMDGYFVLFETWWSGQTPGKRMLGLRVLNEDGHPLDFRGALIRNILRVVDFLPGFYFVGCLFILFHPQGRRVGDLTAGTIVIREGDANLGASGGFSWQASLSSGPDLEVPMPLERLATDTFPLVETFLRRRNALHPAVRFQMGEQIAFRLRQQMELFTGPAAQWGSERLLEEVMRARARRAGL